jgi:hypothetical protein
MGGPDIEAIGDALRFLAARPPVPDGWALRLEQYDDFSSYAVILGHGPIDGGAGIWEAEVEGTTVNAAVSAAIDNINETGFPDTW